MRGRVAAAALALALTLAGCAASDPTPGVTSPGQVSDPPVASASASPSESTTLAAPTLAVGDCTGDIDLSGGSITELPALPCTTEHYWEVFAVVDVPSATYPGADLLAETAKTVDQFMEDNITDDMARDHLTSTYGDVFQKDLSSGAPKMTVATDAVGAGELPSFLKNLGFDSPMDLDPQAVEEVVIPETRRTLAEMRHQSLATMVMMGINRIVVSDGEINAKLVFHIDATESMTLTFNDYKPTNWTLAGKLGGNAFGASGLVVNTMNLNAQSDVNMNAELTGEVRVRFRSDYFPLERFADSQAIQLINSHAKVAQPLPEAAVPAAGSPGVAGAVPPPPPPMEPMPPMPPSGTQQGLLPGRRR